MTQLVVTHPRDIETFKMGLLENAQLELLDAQQNFESARRRGGGHVKALQRAANILHRAEMQVAALKQDFLPMPRMPIRALADWWAQQLNIPQAAEERLADALQAGVFERVAIVVPRQRGRDPLLIGIIGRGTREKHFLIAWWV